MPPLRHYLPLCLLIFPASECLAQLRLPNGDGKQLVERICSRCHDLQTAIDSNRTESQWPGVVETMASRGAKGTENELRSVARYPRPKNVRQI